MKKLEFSYFWENEEAWNEFDLKSVNIINTNWDEKNISFEYEKNEWDEKNHNIIKLIDSKWQVYVENIYDGKRVVQQKYWENTWSYEYTENENGKIIINKIIDRRWNITNYHFDEKWNVIKKEYKKSDWDIINKYEYNENWRLSKEIYPNWNWYFYKYDEKWNVIEKRFKKDVLAWDNPKDIITKIQYDEVFNKPVEIINPNWLITNFTLDEKWQLISTTDPENNKTEFGYLNGQISEIKKWEQITKFIYDDYWNPIEIIDAEGNKKKITYDEFNRITKEISNEWIVSNIIYDENNNILENNLELENWEKIKTTYKYDLLDNPFEAISQISKTKNITQKSKYDQNENTSEIIHPNWVVETNIYDELDRLIESKILVNWNNLITKYFYDKNGNITKEISANNNQTSFEYNNLDRLIKATDQIWNYSIYEYDKAWNVLKLEVFDKNNSPLKKEEYKYNIFWEQIENTKHNLQYNSKQITKFVYNKNWQVISQTDPKWIKTTFEYDKYWNLEFSTLTNWLKTKNIYNKLNQAIEKQIITDNKTISTKYEYDKDWRGVIEMKNGIDSETSSEWQGDISEWQGDISNWQHLITTYKYNNLNQIIQTTNPKQISTFYKYNYNWNILSETTENKTIEYEYDISWNMTKVKDSNWNITKYEYDQLNNLTKKSYPDYSEAIYEYNKYWNLNKTTDPNWTQVNYSYDKLFRLTEKNIILWQWVEWITKETFEYDSLWRLTKWADNLWNEVSFKYNSFNNITTECQTITPNNWEDLVSNCTSYEYDLNQNLIKTIYPNWTEVIKSYDKINRLNEIKTNKTVIATYNYNQLNLQKLIHWNWLETNYWFDLLNRIEEIKQWESIFNYSYDLNWNITSNWADNYDYDNLDRIKAVEYSKLYNSKREWKTLKRKTIKGKTLKERTSKWNKIVRYNYDTMWNRISLENFRLKNKKEKTCTTETIEEKYINKKGKEKTRKKKIKNCDTNTVEIERERNEFNYETNNLNQYTNIKTLNKKDEEIKNKDWTTKNKTFTYDKNWNLKDSWDFRYFYDYKNRLIRVESVKIEDKKSEKVKKDKIKNEKKKVESKKEKVEDRKSRDVALQHLEETKELKIKTITTFSYDILWRRTKKKTNKEVIKYIYSWQNSIIENIYKIKKSKKDKELNLELKETRENIFSNEIDDIISTNIILFKTEKQKQKYTNKKGKEKTKNVKVRKAQQWEIYFYHKNHLWSIIKISNKSWEVVEEYKYDIFGKAYIKNWKSNTYKQYKNSKINNTRLFTWREYDKEIDLYYFRTRYYSDELWRFINRDSIDIVDDVNLYGYVGNNVVGYVDRMGRQKGVLVINIIWSDFFPLRELLFIDKKINYVNFYDMPNNRQNIEYLWNIISSYKDKNIAEIIIVAHWWSAYENGEKYRIDTWNLTWIEKDNIDKLNLNEFNKDLALTLAACNSWKSYNWNESFWQYVSNYLGIKVKAPDDYYNVRFPSHWKMIEFTPNN